jgi:hypothetical protein
MRGYNEHGQSESMSAAIDSIELVREYRRRLVTDVVTRKAGRALRDPSFPTWSVDPETAPESEKSNECEPEETVPEE